ncbi:MAG: hypothetical protein ACI4SS_00110, partial [Clostridia bacterium]
ENGAQVAKELVAASGNAMYSEPISSKHTSDENGDFFTDDAVWVKVDVTEIVKSATGDKVTMLLVLPSGLIKFANAEKAVEGGVYENKAAYLSLSDGATVTATGATYVTKDGSKVDGETVTIADGDSVRAYVDGAKAYLVNAEGVYAEAVTAAGTYTAVKADTLTVTPALGYVYDEARTDKDSLTIEFAVKNLAGNTATVKVGESVIGAQAITTADEVVAVVPKNANIPYTIEVSDTAGTVIVSATQALYPLVIADIAENITAYTAKGATISRVAQAVQALTEGGAVYSGTTFGDSRDSFMTITDNGDETTTIAISDELFANGFGFKVGVKAGVEGSVAAATGAEGVFQSITVSADGVTVQAADGSVLTFSLDAVEIEFVEETVVEEEINDDLTLDSDFTEIM